ncbi:DsbA family oxidoreductase [Rhizobiaceae bacterium BDR2-2]|uniref:DsbA family oxidoreductase n=1 Tax=Ectorhizobium quercum TaxID=2965071 RepID=A0AAE3SUW8_9HYPH|nr:DsbA family oxidoreductase [Ectorhizobium quercum]MCX8997700.1 DsbA family oxidoreductase [Ectorhizobium quercum]
MASIRIDVVSDVVCPWCYLGKARLELAVAEIQDDISAEIHWQPYQLNPDYPPEGVDHQKTLADKLGGAENVGRIHENLRALGREVGIVYDFEAIKIGPNTLDAHRLIHWAGIEGPEIQDAVVTALFRANFEEGRNVGDPAVLVGIAAAAGMGEKVIAALLASDADKDVVRQHIAAARHMGVSGVPFFIIDGKYAISGAQTPDVLADAFRQIAADKDGNRKDLN